MLGGEAGQGLAAEVGELVDRLLRLGEPFPELGVFCLEPGELGLARVGDLAGLTHDVQASLELDAQMSVGAGAVERGAVDGGIAGEGLDVSPSRLAGSRRTGAGPSRPGCGSHSRAAELRRFSCGVPAHGGSGGVDLGDDAEGPVVVGLEPGAFCSACGAELAEEGPGASDERIRGGSFPDQTCQQRNRGDVNRPLSFAPLQCSSLRAGA